RPRSRARWRRWSASSSASSGWSSRSSWSERAGVIWNREAECEPPSARAARQLERLRETVVWTTTRVPFHRERLGGARLGSLEDLAALPFTRQERSARAISLRALRRSAGRAGAHPCLVRHQGQAHHGRLHGGRSRRLARGHGARDDR